MCREITVISNTQHVSSCNPLPGNCYISDYLLALHSPRPATSVREIPHALLPRPQQSCVFSQPHRKAIIAVPLRAPWDWKWTCIGVLRWSVRTPAPFSRGQMSRNEANHPCSHTGPANLGCSLNQLEHLVCAANPCHDSVHLFLFLL